MLRALIVAVVTISFSPFTALAADPVTLISASRSVTVTASASGSGMMETNSDSNTAIDFNPFHGTVSQSAMEPDPVAGTNFAMGSASQDSSISTASFSLSQSIHFTEGVAIAGSPGDAAGADAISLFEVGFSVAQLMVLNIFIEREILHGGQGYSEQFSLSSIDHGNLNLSPGTLSGSVSFEITLFPEDVYTLRVLEDAGSNFPDPFGQEGGSTTVLNASFMAVPEMLTFWPSAILVTAGMTIAFLKKGPVR